MPVMPVQLTLNVPSNIQYPVHPEIMVRATAAEAEDWLSWLQAQAACEDYDRDEPDRFGLGVDARAVFETRGKYTTSPNGDLWRKVYRRTLRKLEESCAEAESLRMELERYKARERQEQKQLDLWCDHHDTELPC